MIKTKMAYWQVLNLMHAWSLNIIVSALQIIKISANTLVSFPIIRKGWFYLNIIDISNNFIFLWNVYFINQLRMPT